jgi:hypothetical protein
LSQDHLAVRFVTTKGRRRIILFRPFFVCSPRPWQSVDRTVKFVFDRSQGARRTQYAIGSNITGSPRVDSRFLYFFRSALYAVVSSVLSASGPNRAASSNLRHHSPPTVCLHRFYHAVFFRYVVYSHGSTRSQSDLGCEKVGLSNSPFDWLVCTITICHIHPIKIHRGLRL